jgi:hypothetical protein
MDWMLNFLSEVVLYGVGSMTIVALTFGKLRAAPIKAERAFTEFQAGSVGWSGEPGRIL